MPQRTLLDYTNRIPRRHRCEVWHPALTVTEREALTTLFAVKDRFTLLELKQRPWGHTMEELRVGMATDAVYGLDYWKDCCRAAPTEPMPASRPPPPLAAARAASRRSAGKGKSKGRSARRRGGGGGKGSAGGGGFG